MTDALQNVPRDAAVETDILKPSGLSDAVVDAPVSSPSALTYVIPALGLVTAACGEGGGGTPTSPPPPPPTTVQVLKPQNDGEAARFILRARLSASDAEITNIKLVGYAPWLNTDGYCDSPNRRRLARVARL